MTYDFIYFYQKSLILFFYSFNPFNDVIVLKNEFSDRRW